MQGNHLQLICEAADRRALSRGMQGLAIRVARKVNRRLERRGRLFGERYHARILRTPTEVRRALVYVLNNSRRHRPGIRVDWIDPLSSAPWFKGWRWRIREPWARPSGPPPVVDAETWLLTTGWRLRGLIGLDEIGREHSTGMHDHDDGRDGTNDES